MNSTELDPTIVELAKRALGSFMDDEVELERLGLGTGLSLKVTSESGPLLLRLHTQSSMPEHPSFHEPAVIESECAWLSALAEDTRIVAPRPRRTRDGGFVHVATHPVSGAMIPCTLLDWVEGEPLRGKRSAEHAAQLGRLLAALHDHAARWSRPETFERPTHNFVAWRAGLARCVPLVELGIASTAELSLLTQAIDVIDRELTPLASEPERIGLIHADLHADNYVVHQGELRPIDFGRAGLGPWAYDLAECMTHLSASIRSNLVEAYAETRTFEEPDLRRTEGYFVASLIEMFGNNAARTDEHAWLRAAIPGWSPHIQRYVEGRTFLFEL